ncbi:MAG: hypothetical protein ACHRXM_18170 [Isosphaerales bacterium]
MKINQTMLDCEVFNVLSIEETQIPDHAFTDIVAVAFPCFRGRILAHALLGGFPGCSVGAESVQRAQDDVPDLAVFQVACLRHHDDVTALSIQQLADGKHFLARGKIQPHLRPPANDRAGKDDISLRQRFLGGGRSIPPVTHLHALHQFLDTSPGSYFLPAP